MEKNGIRRVKKKIHYVFSKKNLTASDYEYVQNLLQKIKWQEYEFYLLSFAKLELKFGNYYEAEKNLILCEQTFPNNPSMHYQFYKVNVHNQNFDEALRRLQIFQNINEDYDLTLPLLMLKKLEDIKEGKKEEYEVKEVKKHIMVDLPKSIREKYNEILNLVCNEEYKIALEKLEEVNNIIIEEDIPMEADSMITILKAIIKEYEIQRLNYYLKLENIEELASNKDYEEMDYAKVPVLDLTIFLNKVSKVNPEFAQVLLDKYQYKILNKKVINILQKDINESSHIASFDKKMKGRYYNYNKNLEEAMQNEDYELAYDEASVGYYVTESTIFLFHMAKALYYKQEYEEAEKLFEEYMKIGGRKYFQAAVYLARTKVNLGKIGSANKQVHELKKIGPYFNKTFTYISEGPYRLEGVLLHASEFDSKKAHESKKIGTSFDFQQNEIFPFNLEEYDSYNFQDKVSIIRYLYLTNKKNQADNYLKKLEPTEKKEHQMKQELERNKVLYLNKAKKGN